jgi:hypothetical protein
MSQNIRIMLFATLMVSTVALAQSSSQIQGSGLGTDVSQGLADKFANDAALSQLNGSCMGPISNRQKTSDSCMVVGAPNQSYQCTVTYVAQCHN